MTEEEVAAVENGDEAPAAEAPAGPQHMLMTDSYPGISKLVDDNWKCEGAPNWRRVPGFPIYATGGYNDNTIIITMIIICVKGGYDPKQRCQPFDIYIFL